MKRSTFRRRKGAPSNAAYFGYLATYNPFNEPFFGSRRAFLERCEADRQSNRLRPLPTKHEPGETGRQLAARLRAVAPVEPPVRKSRAKKVAA